MALRMPAPDQDVLARRREIVAALREIVPGEGVIDAEDELRAYECDALSVYRQLPMVAVLPSTTDQVSRILRYCHENRVRVVPRGAGTSLSGGALPLADGAAGRHQPRHLDCGRLERLLLRAGSLQPDRLHDRRQHRRELGRRSLA
jgi:FAD/FMN-containing dehydrogenase